MWKCSGFRKFYLEKIKVQFIMPSANMFAVAMLALVGLVDISVAQNSSIPQTITDDTVFYGQSPPVYPTRTLTIDAIHHRCLVCQKLIGAIAMGKGTGNWAEAYEKAAAMVAQMTMDEKVRIWIAHINVQISDIHSQTSHSEFPAQQMAAQAIFLLFIAWDSQVFASKMPVKV